MPQKPPTHTQDLREAVASIISMMLGLLRAQGWRGLLHLPEIVMGTVFPPLRSIGKRFAALMDAYAAGILPVAPPFTTAPDPQAAPAQPPATPRVRAHALAPRSAAVRRSPRAPDLRMRAFACVRARCRDPSPLISFPHRFASSARPDGKKSLFWPRCLGTPISLRYRNELGAYRKSRNSGTSGRSASGIG